jgi:hypothetical protein
LPLIVLKELEELFGFRTEELLKEKIKAMPDSILTPSDKKSRSKMIRDNLKKITTKDASEYDISELLKEKINDPDSSTPFICEEKG